MMGAMNLTTKYQLLKITPSLICNSSKISSFFITQPTKIAMKIPPIGSIILLVRKSVKSKKFIPNILNSDIKLKERALKIPSVQAKAPNAMAAYDLLVLRDSTSQATPGSIKEIEELSAAMLKRIKNKVLKDKGWRVYDQDMRTV